MTTIKLTGDAGKTVTVNIDHIAVYMQDHTGTGSRVQISGAFYSVTQTEAEIDALIAAAQTPPVA